jgi:hypothetical protein
MAMLLMSCASVMACWHSLVVMSQKRTRLSYTRQKHIIDWLIDKAVGKRTPQIG